MCGALFGSNLTKINSEQAKFMTNSENWKVSIINGNDDKADNKIDVVEIFRERFLLIKGTSNAKIKMIDINQDKIIDRVCLKYK